MEDFDQIKQIDSLFRSATEVPRLSAESIAVTLEAYRNVGYRAVAGALNSFQDEPKYLVSMIELAKNHINKGAVYGPYVFSDNAEQQPGVMLWIPLDNPEE